MATLNWIFRRKWVDRKACSIAISLSKNTFNGCFTLCLFPIVILVALSYDFVRLEHYLNDSGLPNVWQHFAQVFIHVMKGPP